jgi:predicted RND superfamily exporter protein
MESNGNQRNHIQKYTEWILTYRWFVVLTILFLTLISASGVRYLDFATDYRVFFSEDNPQLLAFDELQNVYTQNDNIVVDPADGDPFSQRSSLMLESMVDESWKLPYAIRVDAVSNFQYSTASEDDLLVADLIEDANSIAKKELSNVKNIAIHEPLLKSRLVSDDGKIVGINITVQLPGKSINEVPEAAAAAYELAEEIESNYPGTSIYVTGVVMINNAFVQAGQNDLVTVFPVMFLIIIIFMIATLRSIWGTLSTISLIGMSAAIAVGITGWLGVQLTPTSAQAPTMIMTLAVADSIHILVTMLQEMRKGNPKRDAIIESMRVNFIPVFLTSVTTAIGFLSLNFSDSPPYRHLGNITALGVIFAFILSVTFLPSVLSILPIKVRQAKKVTTGFLSGFAEWVVNRYRFILGGSIAVIILAISLVPKIDMNDEFVKYFDNSIEFRTDTDFANEKLTGLTTIEHSISYGQEGGISEPEYLMVLESLAFWYEQQPNVVHVNHLGLVMKRLNMNMHGDDSSYYKIPESRELSAQYLLLYEMSLPYGLDLNNMISVDKSSTRFTVTLTDIPSNDLIALSKRGEDWLKKNAPVAMHAGASSPPLMFSYLSRRQVMSMVTGSIIALLLITVSMVFALRSVRYGLLSLIPNVIPIVLGFGAWAVLVGEIGLAHSTIVGMTLGIVVDDTVHFLNKYLRARREHGMTAAESINYAFDTVGRALIITSTALIAGFLVLSGSAFKLNASLGQLAALTIGFALIADFLLLPAILLVVDRKKQIILHRSDNTVNELATIPVTEK